MHLCDLKIDDYAYIKKINLPEFSKVRLYNLGLIEGTLVKVSLIGNGIKAYMFRNTLVAIRDCDSKNIMVGVVYG